MNLNFDTLQNSLTNMSADELNKSARRLARSEKQYTAGLICHLAEIMSRKLYLEYGYANIFEYCVKRLGFSEGATQLRRHVAGAARRFPQLLEAIADLRISVSVAAKIAPHLTDDNVARVLADCAGMTKREVEEYAVTMVPKPVVRAGIRRQPSAPRAATGTQTPAAFELQDHTVGTANPMPAAQSGHPTGSHEHCSADNGHSNEDRTRRKRSARLEPARPEVFNFRFAGSRKFKDALVRLAEVTGLHPERDMAALLERAVDCALDKSDPQRRSERRNARQRRRRIPQQATASGARVLQPHRPGDAVVTPRPHLPAAVRDRVLARAGQRCEYRGPDGRRCTCRTGLQIEHDPPFTVTGSHDRRSSRHSAAVTTDLPPSSSSGSRSSTVRSLNGEVANWPPSRPCGHHLHRIDGGGEAFPAVAYREYEQLPVTRPEEVSEVDGAPAAADVLDNVC